MRKHFIPALLCALGLLAFGGCYKPQKDSNALGTAKNPIVMAFVPSTEAEGVIAGGEELAALLSTQTGLRFKPLVATSYVGIVEAMAAGQVQVGWLPPMAYVFARERNGDEALLKVIRHGKPTYRGQIVVLAESPLQQLADLRGKRIAFAEQASASGHLYPRALLLENGIDPDKDCAEVQYSGGHEAALLALINGNADAVGCFDDARNQLKASTLPDILEKTRVLAYTQEIPADNVTVVKGLDPALRQQIQDGLLALAASEQGKKVLFDLYEIEGLVPATDADYEPVRQMAQLLKLNVEEEVKKGK